MTELIIVVDTNILTKSPFLSSDDWSKLLGHVEEWNLRLVVPEVVLMETVNVVRRNWREKRDSAANLQRWAEGIGTAGELETIVTASDKRINDYEETLRGRLAELGIEIAPVPTMIDHLEIARRASERRAPYGGAEKAQQGQAKDGYRDTLIWLTFLGLAEDRAECHAWLVSDNYSDFGAKSEKKDPGDVADYPLQWHPQLQTEVDERGLSGRVFYARSLRRMEQHLLAKYSPLSPEEREELWDSVDIDDLHRRLTEGIYSTPLDPRSAALPLATTAAWVIASVYGSEDFELSEAAHRPGGAWTGRATCEIDATIEVTKTSGDVVEVRKPLIVFARIDVTDNNEISSLSIESINAEATDPQHRAWKRADAAQWSGIADSITAANTAHLRGLIEPITAATAAHLRGLIEPAGYDWPG